MGGGRGKAGRGWRVGLRMGGEERRGTGGDRG